MKHLVSAFVFAVATALSSAAIGQVCPVSSGNAQFNSVADLGGQNDGGSTPFTYTFTPGAGSNRALVLVITYENQVVGGAANNFGAVKFGGQPMTQFVSALVQAPNANANRVAIYFLNETGLAAATSNTVSVAFSNTGAGNNPSQNFSIQGIAANTLLFQNVNQAAPLAEARSAQNNAGGTSIGAPEAMTVSAGDFVIAAAVSGSGNSDFTQSVGYTMYNDLAIQASHAHAVAYRQPTASESTQPGFTVSASALRLAFVAAKIQPATTGTACLSALVTPLPVTLTHFAAEPTAAGALLQWTTANEDAASYFAIERSTDGTEFREVGRVAATGTSTTEQRYRLTDAGFGAAGTVHYRIRTVDLDGSSAVSAVRSLQTGETMNTAAVTFFPNPARGAVRIGGAAQGSTVRLFDGSGRAVRTASIQAGAGSLDLSGLPAGNYYAQVVGTDGRATAAQPLVVMP